MKIVFACVHNAGRSQMAAAFFNALSLSDCIAVSAGTEPADRVHPEVVEVMKEVGIDLATAKPQFLSAELVQDAGLLITMGCGDKCPFVPGLQVRDWKLADPKGQDHDAVRNIRDEIKLRVNELASELSS